MGRCGPRLDAGADELFEDLLAGVAWENQPAVPLRPLGGGTPARGRHGGRAIRCRIRRSAEAHRALQHRYGARFDGFGMIQYRNGRDGQAFHRDTDMRWLDDTVIAMLSLGARRPWLLRPASQPL